MKKIKINAFDLRLLAAIGLAALLRWLCDGHLLMAILNIDYDGLWHLKTWLTMLLALLAALFFRQGQKALETIMESLPPDCTVLPTEKQYLRVLTGAHSLLCAAAVTAAIVSAVWYLISGLRGWW